ncbi:MFS transporter [uncultured Caulobacter sp.]|uniref:MFS transporter n=1 Tax=uncultured Caulobacter sp. TaxID=158749 RepID=UPI0026283BC2|nr:MFS transporter [uncultured Caulobacter sp.]
MPVALRARLGLLFYLQYFAFGAWFVPLGAYMSKGLGFDAYIGYAYAGQGVATILSTLLVGMIADRVLAPERVLTILLVLSGAALLALPEAHSIQVFLPVLFLAFLFFIPTIAIANAVCLHWLSDPATEFPKLRVLGTVGWISSGLAIGSLQSAAASALPLLIGGGVNLALAVYTMTLPRTHGLIAERPRTLRAVFGLDLVDETTDRSFFVLLAAALLITLSAAFYYAYANTFLLEAGVTINWAGWTLEATAIQSLGQASELLFLLLLPVCLRVFGMKGVFMLGIASWLLRCLLFAAGYHPGGSGLWLLVIGVLLHGAANDFVQVAGQIYVDRALGPNARARAQALFTTVIMGVGAVLGSFLANMIYTANTDAAGRHNWSTIWLVPAGLALGTLIWFWMAFRPGRAIGDVAEIPY